MTKDWREEQMDYIRALIKEVDPEVSEEQKYKKATNPDGVPVWYHDGMICTGETYKEHLRFTFSKGKELNKRGFSEILNAHIAIVIKKDDKLNEKNFKDLIRAAVALNQEKKK
jgi:hypothetical protein